MCLSMAWSQCCKNINCATRYSEAKQCLKGVALSCCRRWSKCLSVLNKCFCFTMCVQCFWKNKVNCIPLKELEEGWCKPRAQVHAEFAKVFGQRCGDQVKIKSFSNYSLRIWRISLNFEIFCCCYYKRLLSALITCFFLHCHLMLQGMRFVAVVYKIRDQISINSHFI